MRNKIAKAIDVIAESFVYIIGVELIAYLLLFIYICVCLGKRDTNNECYCGCEYCQCQCEQCTEDISR